MPPFAPFAAASPRDPLRPAPPQRRPRWACLLTGALLALSALAAQPTSASAAQPTSPSAADAPAGPAPAGMAWIPRQTFAMGTDEKEAYAAERPAHQVAVEGFWMDTTEVSNAQFAAFVEATGYVTLAERVPDWEELKKQLPPGSPRPPDAQLVAGSLVFTPLSAPPREDNPALWWKYTPGASWRHPEGPASSVVGRESYPVVQVAWDDAAAYARWAGKRLPTEAEWEGAARGGLASKRYLWGDEFRPGGKLLANIWQGQFPCRDLTEDGFAGAAPVKSFPPNPYGLFDMTGNVWEWCADWYDARQHAVDAAACTLCRNPRGPAQAANDANHYNQRVTKGGSFLCAENYCLNYRPSSRRGTDHDTGMSHLGFRCAADAAPRTDAPQGKPANPKLKP